MKLHENRFYDSRDSDQTEEIVPCTFVLSPPCKLPLFIKLQPRLQHLIAHAFTVCDVTFHENRPHDSRDTDQRCFVPHAKRPSLLTSRKLMTFNAHACTVCHSVQFQAEDD